MWQKIRSSKIRLISSLVILSVLIPLLLLTYYVNVFHYISLVVFTLFGMYALFEVYVTLGINKLIAIFTSLIIIPFLFLPYDPEFIDLLDFPGAPIPIRMIWAFGDWRSYLIIFLGSFVPILIDRNLQKTVKRKILNQSLVVMVTFITAIFVKSFWILNVSSIIHIIFFISVGVIADTFAYLGGMLLGLKWKAKLAPNISPNKTWVGFIVGFIATLCFAIFVGWYLDIWKNVDSNILVICIISGFVFSIVAPLGDLFFSAIKRYANVKDFSNLIPGHGGIFDRIDALSIVIFTGTLFFVFA